MFFLQPSKLSRGQRFAVLLVLYLAVLAAATWVAYGLRFDFAVPLDHQHHIIEIWVWVWAVKLLALAIAGQFYCLLSFFSLPDLKRLGVALGIVTLGLFGQWYAVDAVGEMSRGVIVLDGILSFLGLAACRLGFRLVRQGTGSNGGRQTGTRVAIVGAGEVGAALARELQIKATLQPVAFFDDAKRKHGTQIHGVPVASAVENLREANALKVDEVIIAMPSAPGARVREVLALLDELGLRCRTVPSMSQLAVGDMVTALRPVEIADVLGRETVDLGTETVREFLTGKTVLVTGAGGSIGSELCRQLAQLGPAKLILVERSEFQLFEIHTEIESAITAVPELIDVQDTPAIAAALERHLPDVIFHAAAFKHVSMMERQPAVAIRNNVLATHRFAATAAKHGVGRFILISTDKAVAPSSVMGATKALAEQVLQGHALERRAGDGTRFITVRFGNVLGSSGSVVPIFQKQIELGGPVTVTDEAVTRFFMSIPEAAGLVLRSAAMGEGGDRFILDMGEPVRIAELAADMIRLTGREPNTDIAVEFTGLRPGEKMHEALHSAAEQLVDTEHTKIQRITGAALTAADWEALKIALQRGGELDDAAARAWLRELLPEYEPTSPE
ncbi:MAG: polysaccharide biosynthesis protein [Verrucomicrobia subdivision 3 bacterium]|nr:polysaccharide biosynthesis protein [Limisphaerales bacterium]